MITLLILPSVASQTTKTRNLFIIIICIGTCSGDDDGGGFSPSVFTPATASGRYFSTRPPPAVTSHNALPARLHCRRELPSTRTRTATRSTPSPASPTPFPICTLASVHEGHSHPTPTSISPAIPPSSQVHRRGTDCLFDPRASELKPIPFSYTYIHIYMHHTCTFTNLF